MSLLIDGIVVDEGSIPVDDRGYLLGDGLFETIAVDEGAPRFLSRHFARLAHGAEVIGIPLPFDERRLVYAFDELIGATATADGVIRLTVTRGGGPRGYAPPVPATPRWIATARSMEPAPPRWYEQGITLHPSSYRRDEASPLAAIKSISALDRVMAANEYRAHGADEGMLLDTVGRITSAVAANLFWVQGGKLQTPAMACGPLPGVTRGVVMEQAIANGIACAQVKETPETLEGADEMFITNALIGVVPVREVTGWFGPKEPGPVTQRVADLYTKARNSR